MSEIDYLVGCVLIYFANIGAQTVFANMRYDVGALAGPRDGFEPEGKYLMRARRAQANLTEALVMFAPLVLAAVATGRTSGITLLGAAVFFWARLVYPVVYIAGLAYVRTLVWLVGVIGTGMVFWAVAPWG